MLSPYLVEVEAFQAYTKIKTLLHRHTHHSPFTHHFSIQIYGSFGNLIALLFNYNSFPCTHTEFTAALGYGATKLIPFNSPCLQPPSHYLRINIQQG